MKRLIKVQKELKAPKGQFNSFGKYKYRSCEDILEAVKPLLSANGLAMTITDEVVVADGRFYIKATACVFGEDGNVVANNSAYAREDETKKGMDGSQITGTASSYARKYALNGLFLIDDTKDADTNEHREQTTQGGKQAEEKPAVEVVKEQTQKASTTTKPDGWDNYSRGDKEARIVSLCEEKQLNLSAVLKEANVSEMKDLTDIRLLALYNYIETKK